MLPKPKNPLGYTSKELQNICKDRNIKFEDFNKAFGRNTCAMTPKGIVLYYPCDVERALYKLGNKDGKFHEWD